MKRATSAYHCQNITFHPNQCPEVFDAKGLESTTRNRYGFGLFIAKNKAKNRRKNI